MKTITESTGRVRRLAEAMDVEQIIRERMEQCPYRFVFNKVTWDYDQGRLTFSGSVPTFHLKQLLQEMVRDIGQVQQIANLVDVVSATGLSSERQDCQRQ
jgi:hypothetical protein